MKFSSFCRKLILLWVLIGRCLAVRNIIELKIESDAAGLPFVCIHHSRIVFISKATTMTPIYWMTYNFSVVQYFFFFQFNKFNETYKRRVGIVLMLFAPHKPKYKINHQSDDIWVFIFSWPLVHLCGWK